VITKQSLAKQVEAMAKPEVLEESKIRAY